MVVERFVVIGTSLGGLMTMIMAVLRPGLLQAAVLNDIGPIVESAGLERIKAYVGCSEPPRDWNEAAATARAINGLAFPDYTDADWLRFARRTFREGADGRPVPAYDAAIARPVTDTCPHRCDVCVLDRRSDAFVEQQPRRDAGRAAGGLERLAPSGTVASD